MVPILIDDARMPGEADLPSSLAPLAYRNALDLDQGRDFHPHVDRLIKGIERLFQQPNPAIAVSPRQPNRSWIWVCLTVLPLLAVLGIVIHIVTDTGTVKITGTDPNMVVRIDGRAIKIENVGEPITLRAGARSRGQAGRPDRQDPDVPDPTRAGNAAGGDLYSHACAPPRKPRTTLDTADEGVDELDRYEVHPGPGGHVPDGLDRRG